jgi:CubicO group peptidase (beta-lactamase class C family)
MKNILFLLLVSFSLFSCLKDEPFKLDYKGFEPKSINDDWQLSTPQSENMDSDLLEKAFRLIYDDDRYLMARSLLVFRNGKIVGEAYPNDLNDINKPYNIQSCTKSITSLLIGATIQNNELDSLNELLYAIYPESFDSEIDKRTITIKDALCMQTGLEFDNGVHTQQLYETGNNSIEFILKQNKIYKSGTIMKYNDGAPHLISKVVEKKTGKSLSEYANEKLFKPLNIVDWKWEASKDGTTFGAFSLFIKPRDFGKIGQLLLQNGEWDSNTLIDNSYLSEATSIQTSANFNSEPYGYYFGSYLRITGIVPWDMEVNFYLLFLKKTWL